MQWARASRHPRRSLSVVVAVAPLPRQSHLAIVPLTTGRHPHIRARICPWSSSLSSHRLAPASIPCRYYYRPTSWHPRVRLPSTILCRHGIGHAHYLVVVTLAGTPLFPLIVIVVVAPTGTSIRRPPLVVTAAVCLLLVTVVIAVAIVITGVVPLPSRTGTGALVGAMIWLPITR